MIGIRQPIEDILIHLKSMDELSFVAKYNNQFDLIDNASIYSFQMPCAFLEVLNPVSSLPLLGGYIQKEVVFRIHIGVNFFNDANDLMEQNFIIFDLKDKIHRSLYGFKPTNCSSLIQVGQEQDYSHTNVYHGTLDFGCTFIDTISDTQNVDSGEMVEHTITNIDLDIILQSYNYMRLNVDASFDNSFNDDFMTGYTITDNNYGDLLVPEIYQREYII